MNKDFDTTLIEKLVKARREGRQEGISEVVDKIEDILFSDENIGKQVMKLIDLTTELKEEK